MWISQAQRSVGAYVFRVPWVAIVFVVFCGRSVPTTVVTYTSSTYQVILASAAGTFPAALKAAFGLSAEALPGLLFLKSLLIVASAWKVPTRSVWPSNATGLGLFPGCVMRLLYSLFNVTDFLLCLFFCLPRRCAVQFRNLHTELIYISCSLICANL